MKRLKELYGRFGFFQDPKDPLSGAISLLKRATSYNSFSHPVAHFVNKENQQQSKIAVRKTLGILGKQYNPEQLQEIRYSAREGKTSNMMLKISQIQQQLSNQVWLHFAQETNQKSIANNNIERLQNSTELSNPEKCYTLYRTNLLQHADKSKHTDFLDKIGYSNYLKKLGAGPDETPSMKMDMDNF